MQYLMLIQIDEVAFAARQTAELRAAQQAWTRGLVGEGVFVAADRLRPPTTARTVRRESGRIMCTDGPFVETKEHLGGYYLIDVPDEAEARRRAAKMPVAAHCPVFVLPIEGARLLAREGDKPAEQTMLLFYGAASGAAPSDAPADRAVRAWVPIGDAVRRHPVTPATVLGEAPRAVALVDGGVDVARAIAEKAVGEGGAAELRPVVMFGG